MSISSSSWGVIVANHKQTRRVGEALFSLGIEHFIPKIESLTIRNGRHERSMYPLLGDYILTAITSKWKIMLRIREVSGIIMNCDGFPAQVLPEELKRLHEMCDDAGIHHPVKYNGEFEYGQRVTPKTGPFAYHIGRYDKKTRRGDSALFSLFGREQRVIFKKGDLLAV